MRQSLLVDIKSKVLSIMDIYECKKNEMKEMFNHIQLVIENEKDRMILRVNVMSQTRAHLEPTKILKF